MVLYQIITFIIVIPLLTTNTYDVEGKGKMSLIQVLSNDICSNKSEIPVQIKCNACILLCKMVETVRSVPEKRSVIELIKSNTLNGLKQIKEDSELYKYTNALISALEK